MSDNILYKKTCSKVLHSYVYLCNIKLCIDMKEGLLLMQQNFSEFWAQKGGMNQISCRHFYPNPALPGPNSNPTPTQTETKPLPQP